MNKRHNCRYQLGYTPRQAVSVEITGRCALSDWILAFVSDWEIELSNGSPTHEQTLRYAAAVNLLLARIMHQY